MSVPLERAWGDGGSVADAQAAHFPRLLLIVFLGQCIELARVFFLDGASFSVELLDVVEPGDAASDLQCRRLAREGGGAGGGGSSRGVVPASRRRRGRDGGHTQALTFLKPSYRFSVSVHIPRATGEGVRTHERVHVGTRDGVNVWIWGSRYLQFRAKLGRNVDLHAGAEDAGRGARAGTKGVGAPSTEGVGDSGRAAVGCCALLLLASCSFQRRPTVGLRGPAAGGAQ